MPISEAHSGAPGATDAPLRLESPGADEREPRMCWKCRQL